MDEELKTRQETETRLLRELLDRISAYAEDLETKQGLAELEITSLRRSSEQWKTEAAQLRLALNELHNSRSWKITLPVRLLSRLIRRLFGLPSRALRNLVKQARAFGNGQNPDRQKSKPEKNRARTGPGDLSPRENEIYGELKQIIDKKMNGN